jgi:hypothetical protein
VDAGFGLAGDLAPRYSALARADEERASKSMWLIELSGDQMDIVALQTPALVFGFDITSEHEGHAWLSGGGFGNLTSVEEAQEKAIKILTLLNGIARSRAPNQFCPVQFCGLSQKRPDGTKAHFAAASFAGRGSFPGGEDAGGMGRAARIRDNPKLCEIAEAIGGEITWQRLRVAFERVCVAITGKTGKGSWDNALVKKRYATQDDLDRFKDNIQDPRLSGLDAVHGVSTGPPPKGTKMTEQQGLEFIVRLLNTYLDGQP